MSTWTWDDLEREATSFLADLEPDYVAVDIEAERHAPVYPDTGVYWLACYVVQGSSEGFYVHVDRLQKDPESGRMRGLLVKLWRLEDAIEASARLTRVIIPRAWT